MPDFVVLNPVTTIVYNIWIIWIQLFTPFLALPIQLKIVEFYSVLEDFEQNKGKFGGHTFYEKYLHYF